MQALDEEQLVESMSLHVGEGETLAELMRKRFEEEVEFNKKNVWSSRMPMLCTHGSVLGNCPICPSSGGRLKTEREGVLEFNTLSRTDAQMEANAYYTTQRALLVGVLRKILHTLVASEPLCCYAGDYARLVFDQYESESCGSVSTVSSLKMLPRQKGEKHWTVYVVLDYVSLYDELPERPRAACLARVQRDLKMERFVGKSGDSLIRISDTLYPGELPAVGMCIRKMVERFSVASEGGPTVGFVCAEKFVQRRAGLLAESGVQDPSPPYKIQNLDWDLEGCYLKTTSWDLEWFYLTTTSCEVCED
jgi:hypothetical protein